MEQSRICKSEWPPGYNERIGHDIRIQRVVLESDMRKDCLELDGLYFGDNVIFAALTMLDQSLDVRSW